MTLPVNEIVCGEVREVLASWPARKVDVVMTSPPYYGVRDYGEGCDTIWGGSPHCLHDWEIEERKAQSYSGQERWQHLYTLPGVTRYKTDEERRQAMDNIREQIKIKSSQCKKCGAWKGQLGLETSPRAYIRHLVDVAHEIRRVLKSTGVFWLNLGDKYSTDDTKRKKGDLWLTKKNKMLMPYRVAIALQEEGWVLRNDITWHKPNAMPSSAGDRFNVTTEIVFLLTPNPQYKFRLDNVRVPHSSFTLQDLARRRNKSYTDIGPRPFAAQNSGRPRESFLHKKGKNPGDVWTIPTRPSNIPHYATWPEELVERMIKASTDEGDIVLDPFNGVGTTTRIARRLRRKFIGIDIKPEFCEIARQQLKAKYRDTKGIKRLE